MINILNEPVIRMDRSSKSHVVGSLPEVYAALIADEVEAFPALRPHQRHAWHAFLVQLGVMAMRQGGRTEPPDDAQAWSKLIRGLTPDYPHDEPWQLAVDDITKPAFLQPPASSRDLDKDYAFPVETPDDMDNTVETSKNHDLKTAVAKQPNYDDWIVSLISVQTQGGRGDRYYQGISRMKGSGYSRTAFSVSICKHDGCYRSGLHVKRDITALTQRWESFTAHIPDFLNAETGHKLIWIVSWDGKKSEAILPNALHPLYIEICRRIRLRLDERGRLSGYKATSRDAPRIEASSNKGQLGDPWIVVDTNGEGLGMRPGGFSYRRIVECFNGQKYTLPFLCYPTTSEQQPDAHVSLIARGIVRFSKGPRATTAGYDERIIPLRQKVIRVFGRVGGVQGFGDLARKRIEKIGIVQRTLRRAIATFAAHDNIARTNEILRSRPRDIPLRQKIDEWVDILDEIVDVRFFEDLQTEFESDDNDERERILNGWLLNLVVKNAKHILEEAVSALPCPSNCRFLARVSADRAFEGGLYGPNGLPELSLRTNNQGNEGPNNA